MAITLAPGGYFSDKKLGKKSGRLFVMLQG
jgi:hypothetical protein